MGTRSTRKIAAALPARPALKKMLVPGAAQSPAFLLEVVGRPTAVDIDRKEQQGFCVVYVSR